MLEICKLALKPNMSSSLTIFLCLIFSRCTVMDRNIFNCGSFDINGLFTENYVYPIQWKLSMIFISLGFIVMTATVFSTLVTCCRQSVLGKSIHNITGSAQVVSGLLVFFLCDYHKKYLNMNNTIIKKI